MSEKVVLVSSLIDETAHDYFKDINLVTFSSLVELREYITDTPIGCNKLVISADCVTASPNEALTMIVEILTNQFFKCQKVLYVTSFNSGELIALNFVMSQNNLEQPEIYQGELTREYLIEVINGVSEREKEDARVRVTRIRREDTIKKNLSTNAKFENRKVQTEEDQLATIDITPVHVPKPQLTEKSNIVQITGAKGRGKTVFSIMLAQAIAKTKRVCLIERDLELFSLSHYVSISGLDILTIDIEQLYSEPLKIITEVQDAPQKIIAITSTSVSRGKKYSVSYITKLIFNLLSDLVDTFVIESDLDSVLMATKTIMILNNDIISLLSDVQEIPFVKDNISYVCLNRSTIPSIAIQDSYIVTNMISELLNTSIDYIPIYSIESLSLGGDCYDIHRFIK